MRLSQKLEEAVFILSDDALLDVLSEDAIHDMRAGDFSTETVEEAFVGILAPYGFAEDDESMVNEAIEEFGESMGLTEGFLDWLKKAAKSALKAVGSAALDAAKEGGKEAVSMTAKELKKKLSAKQQQDKDENKKGTQADTDDEPEKPKKKSEKKVEKPTEKEPEKDEDDKDENSDDIKKNLKNIAGKALGKIADDPGKAKEILKKHGKKAVKAIAKHGVKKGMKMVFGRWIKTKEGSKKEWTTGNGEIDHAVGWLMFESEKTTLNNGMKVYDFEGGVPSWVLEAFDFGGVAPNFTWRGSGRRFSFDPEGGNANFMMIETVAGS